MKRGLEFSVDRSLWPLVPVLVGPREPLPCNVLRVEDDTRYGLLVCPWGRSYQDMERRLRREYAALPQKSVGALMDHIGTHGFRWVGAAHSAILVPPEYRDADLVLMRSYDA